MALTYLKEITDWSDCGCNIPNHTYIFNEKKQNVGSVSYTHLTLPTIYSV